MTDPTEQLDQVESEFSQKRETLRVAAKRMTLAIDECCPESPDREMALRCVLFALSNANMAITQAESLTWRQKKR